MTDILLKLFGIKATEAGNLTEVALRFHGINPAWLLLAAAILAVGVFYIYHRAAADVSPLRKYFMGALRLLFLALILGLLLRPVLRMTFEHVVRRTVLVLFDTSASMSQINDRRAESEDQKRVAIARNLIDPARGLSQELPPGATGAGQPPRLDIVKAAFKNERINLLPRLARHYDLAAFTFDRQLAEIAPAAWRVSMEQAEQAPDAELPNLSLEWIDQLDARGQATALGDAVREVISRKRGQALAGIILVTDGASNSGLQPLDAARLGRQDRVPLYVYGVGITSTRDIIVHKELLAQDVVFAEDEVPVSVRVRSVGLQNQTATLTVKLGDQVEQKQVTFNADGEQTVVVNLKPRKPGDFDILAGIAPREDEVIRDNNVATRKIKVIDGKMKVLLIEQSPRWEFKYLQANLLNDPHVELKCVLLEADPAIARDRNSPYLAEIPKTREDLFKYDVIILGDIDPKYFATDHYDMLDEYVSRLGGGLVVIAGKRFMPSAYRRTAIEKLLPVELESADIGQQAAATRAVRLELTDSGRRETMLRLADKDTESAARWGTLPPVYWVARVARAKPAADVLLVDSDPAKSSRYGKMPVVARHSPGRGPVLYVGTDNFWRWRKNAAHKYHGLLWGQVTRRMGMTHLLGESKRTQLSSDQREYATGQPIRVSALLYNEAFVPMTDQSVKATLTDLTGQTSPRQVLLRFRQPGTYEGETPAPAAGRYAFSVDHDPSVKLELAVADPQLELAEPAMNASLLQQIAAESGGKFFREEDLHSLPEQLVGQPEHQRTTLEKEIWESPLYFLLMLCMVTAEWITRKMSQLK